MKLSTTTAICRTRPDGPLLTMEQSAQWIHEAGFDAVDANFFFSPNEPDTPLLREDWEAWAHAVRARYDAFGLPFDQAHAPAFGIVSPGEPRSEKIDLLFRRSFAVSGILGVQWIVVHPLTLLNTASAAVSRRENLEYFKPLLELAAEHGLSIAIENMFDPRPDGPVRLRRRFGSALDELVDLVDTLRPTHPNVGVCWDTGHANEMNIPQAQALEQIGGRLKALHINDNYAALDDHNIPFHGTIDCWTDIMAALKRIGYTGCLTLETGRFGKHVPTPLLPAVLRYSAEVGRYLIAQYEQS